MDNKTAETPTVFTITKHYRITFTIALGIVMCSGLYAAVSMVANYEQWNIARYTAAIIAAMASAVSLLACIILIRLWVLKSYVVILDEVCIRIPIIIGWRKIAWEKVCAVEAFEIHGDMVVGVKVSGHSCYNKVFSMVSGGYNEVLPPIEHQPPHLVADIVTKYKEQLA